MTSSQGVARTLLGLACSLAFTACVEEEPETCRSSSDCRRGEFCAFAEGCGEMGEGLCRARSVLCSRDREPVCGCDGRTYRNACVAGASAVSVARTGSCDAAVPMDAALDASEPTDAGEPTDVTEPRDAFEEPDAEQPLDAREPADAAVAADASEPADASELADVEVAADAADGSAVSCGAAECAAGEECLRGPCQREGCSGPCSGNYCVAVPAQCPDTRAVVCACDGKSYRNECFARQAGAVVYMQGTCSSCDRGLPDPCAPGDYCDFNARECVPAPSECPDVNTPVCGCDWRTYPSECHAQQGGTSVRSQGACDLGGVRRCNAGDAKPCRADEFCQVDVLVPNSCGSYDGVCAPRPTSCPAPSGLRACLVIGVTTSSVCEANMQGLSTSPFLEHCGFPTGQCGFLATWGYVQCAADEYCGYVDPFCGLDTMSYLICKKIPSTCEGAQGGPLCTCGGLFANGCEAARAQQNVAWMTPYEDENGVLRCPPVSWPWPR